MSELIERVGAKLSELERIADAMFRKGKVPDAGMTVVMGLLRDCKAALSQQEAEPVEFKPRAEHPRLYELLDIMGERTAEQPERLADRRCLVELRGEVGKVVQRLALSLTRPPKPAPLPQPTLQGVPRKEWNQLTGRDGRLYVDGWNDCADYVNKTSVIDEINAAITQPVASVPRNKDQMQLNAVANILIGAFKAAEPDHVISRFPTSYLSTFVDMAEAVIAHQMTAASLPHDWQQRDETAHECKKCGADSDGLPGACVASVPQGLEELMGSLIKNNSCGMMDGEYVFRESALRVALPAMIAASQEGV